MRKVPGISSFPDGDSLLLELDIIGSETRGMWTSVTAEDVRKICEMFGLPYEEILTIIMNKDREVHTMLIEVEKYMEGRKE